MKDSNRHDVFITENFLLETDAASRLYHGYASTLPIIDYHSHLPADEIAGDRRFDNLTQIWLSGDHYKWRAMRACGVDERYISGEASDWEKFLKWAESVPKLLRNPLYHWTHLELKRPFGISDRLLGPETAEGIWNECNEMLSRPEFSCRGLLQQMHVVLVCTTDDPTDSLEFHKSVAEDSSFEVRILPTWRPDMSMSVETVPEFNAWVDQLGQSADIDIRDFNSYFVALKNRHDFFHQVGCRLSDHGLETIVAEETTPTEVNRIFQKVRGGKSLDSEEIAKFQSAMLWELAAMDHERNWTQQYHIGALRSCNTRLLQQIGPDVGCDSIGDREIARPLARFLDRLDSSGQLCQTILYNLNPRDNAVLATMCGNFQEGTTPGKVQFGSAWWYLDQIDGMTEQINTLSNMGVLSNFVGMLTDSRSFLSYPRHEYFRRLLCNILGNDISRGLLPKDFELVGAMVRDICYGNASRYFGFDILANQ